MRPRVRTILIALCCVVIAVSLLLVDWDIGLRVYPFNSEARVTAIAVRKNNGAICEKMSVFSNTCNGMPCVAPEKCRFAVATANHNPDACERTGDLQEHCILASMTDPQTQYVYCAKILSGQGRGDCYAQMAATTDQISICRALPERTRDEKEIKGTCFLAYAKQHPQMSVCEETPDFSYYKDDCYLAVAESTKDAQVCDKIRPAVQKGEDPISFCREQVAHLRSQ